MRKFQTIVIFGLDTKLVHKVVEHLREQHDYLIVEGGIPDLLIHNRVYHLEQDFDFHHDVLYVRLKSEGFLEHIEKYYDDLVKSIQMTPDLFIKEYDCSKIKLIEVEARILRCIGNMNRGAFTDGVTL